MHLDYKNEQRPISAPIHIHSLSCHDTTLHPNLNFSAYPLGPRRVVVTRVNVVFPAYTKAWSKRTSLSASDYSTGGAGSVAWAGGRSNQNPLASGCRECYAEGLAKPLAEQHPAR